MDSSSNRNDECPPSYADQQRELESYKKEVARLKDLVVRLSELVIRNVVHNCEKKK